MMELEEGGTFDEESMPDWMRSMRGVAHRGSIPPPGQPQNDRELLTYFNAYLLLTCKFNCDTTKIIYLSLLYYAWARYFEKIPA